MKKCKQQHFFKQKNEKTFFTYSFAAALTGIVTAQTTPDTIAFTLNKSHNICIKACINQSDTLVLMFHSSASGVSLTNQLNFSP